ncbi:MAG TPA: LytR C-terminal domain-containing protein [Longimicrobiales bacterium]
MSERARRNLRIAGVAALVLVLIAFVVSFLSGIGGGAARVTGDAQQGGERLDRVGPRVRVEVLNASGVAGLARRATEHLRDQGFDVVYIGNASRSDLQTTLVVARTTDMDAAQRVAAALDADSVTVEPDPELYLDVTVELGADWPPSSADAAAADSTFLGRLKRTIRPDSR